MAQLQTVTAEILADVAQNLRRLADDYAGLAKLLDDVKLESFEGTGIDSIYTKYVINMEANIRRLRSQIDATEKARSRASSAKQHAVSEPSKRRKAKKKEERKPE